MNLQWLTNRLMQNNPTIANNPRNQQMLQIIQNGDSQQGQQIADNLCKTYGVSREQAIQMAKQFFGL